MHEVQGSSYKAAHMLRQQPLTASVPALVGPRGPQMSHSELRAGSRDRSISGELHDSLLLHFSFCLEDTKESDRCRKVGNALRMPLFSTDLVTGQSGLIFQN